MITYSIHSSVDGQHMHFADNVTAPTEEEAYQRALVVMGLSYEANKKMKTSKVTAKTLFKEAGYHLRKVK